MEEYKPNSHRSKAQESDPSSKKVERVTTGAVKSKKRSEIQKFADIFIAEDIENVKSYIFMNVVIPAAKKVISDIVDTILYGGSGSGGKATNAAKVSYGAYYNGGNNRQERNTYKNRNVYDFNELIFSSRGDAEAVLDAMNDIISQYHVVCVGDLYDLADVPVDNYAVNKYGWQSVQSASVVRARSGGYLIKLPRPLPLD